MAANDDDDDNSATDKMQVSYASYDGGGKTKKRRSANSAETAGNTIQAVVHEDQTLVTGAVIKLRLLDGIYVNGKMIPKGSFVYGTCALNNERLEVKITSIRYLNNILPVALAVYDLDGMEGLICSWFHRKGCCKKWRWGCGSIYATHVNGSVRRYTGRQCRG